MTANNLITKDAPQNVVAELTKLIQETAATTEAKILVVVDRRFATLQNDSVIKFFQDKSLLRLRNGSGIFFLKTEGIYD